MESYHRFNDRMEAGKLLALKLMDYARRDDVVVLALPRGGVPVGFVVARMLEVPLDVLLVRKLGFPGHQEYAMGAIASGGVCVLQNDVVARYGISPHEVEAVKSRELREIERRESLYRANRPPLQLQGRIVILVDDGIATGSTMFAAVKCARHFEPARLIAAVPVAPPDTCHKLQPEVDELICLLMPDIFYAVGEWYKNFGQTSDEEVIRLLQHAEREQEQRQSMRPQPKPSHGGAERRF